MQDLHSNDGNRLTGSQEILYSDVTDGVMAYLSVNFQAMEAQKWPTVSLLRKRCKESLEKEVAL